MARVSSLTLLVSLGALTAATVSAQAPAPGYRFSGSTDLSLFCGSYPTIAGFDDGSYLLYDGQRLEKRSSDGTVLRTYATFPFPVFASFVELSDDESFAYLGESSTGAIQEVDLNSGAFRTVTSLAFSFDLALDATPGLAYVSAATAGFGTNSVWRVDLAAGAAVEVVQVTGFSGPIAVDMDGDLYVGILDSGFPPAPGSSRIVRFSMAQVTSGQLLTEQDGAVFSSGFDNLSSIEHDPRSGRFLAMETNTGVTGFESVAWLLDANGLRSGQIATTPDFAGGLELVDSGFGTEFGAYQPEYVSLRFAFADCFGTGTWRRWNTTGARPTAVFDGPGLGQTGSATISLEGGVPNGFARLWVARSLAMSSVPVLEHLGGLHPIALQANAGAFLRRSGLLSLDAQGTRTVPFLQDPQLEGTMLLQWLVYDSSAQLVTSSTFAVNRDIF